MFGFFHIVPPFYRQNRPTASSANSAGFFTVESLSMHGPCLNRPVKPAARFSIVFVTAPDLKTARKLARGALTQKLVACANLVPQIESHYWWQGKIESSAEVLCVFKTTRAKLRSFEKFVLTIHPYDTPEIISFPLGSGTKHYLDWLDTSVK
jgi:periplasmic divalent cation tolerance protein